MAITTALLPQRHSRTQECRFVKARAAGLARKRHGVRGIAIVAGQTESGSAGGPWLLSAGIRVDETHYAASMPAIVVA